MTRYLSSFRRKWVLFSYNFMSYLEIEDSRFLGVSKIKGDSFLDVCINQ
jgi:hypothetical protein